MIGAAIREIDTDDVAIFDRGAQWQTNRKKIRDRSCEIYAHSRRRRKLKPEGVSAGLCAILMAHPSWDRTGG